MTAINHISIEYLYMRNSPIESTDTSRNCDLLVIGGGINGTGIARDAAGRGLSVILCEQDDLASHTSSASTKLIHGGLRYLEQYEFKLVRKALDEREVLMRAAPHLIGPLRFVLPHNAHQRPAWLIRAGLFIYDHLARRELLPASSRISLQEHPAGGPLKSQFVDGFCYSDAWVDDARLVISNAMDAAARGVTILTRTRFMKALKQDRTWLVNLHSEAGTDISVNARCIVNAAGPWVTQVLQSAIGGAPRRALRLVKGSHIVVKKLFDHPYAYIFQHPDRRIVFAIPYESDFTLIGTTDVEYHGDPARVAITDQEIDYLCNLCNYYFKRPTAPKDVVSTYSGVRPLLDDASGNASTVTRDYYLDLDLEGAPILSIFGGKITTYRKLAEEAMDQLAPILRTARGAWTAHVSLPGGDIDNSNSLIKPSATLEDFIAGIKQEFDWLPLSVVRRYARSYGTGIYRLLNGKTALTDLGQEILPGLFEAEAKYWIENEWAVTAKDMLWRRSKLGLHVGAEGEARLERWIHAQGSGHPAASTG